MTVPILTADDWTAMLATLMPPGPAWSDEGATEPDKAFVFGSFDRLLGGRQIGRVTKGDIAPTDLRDLITISLFTWARALDDDPIPADVPRQGWWADSGLGSRLWILLYGKLTRAAVSNAARYVEASLAWLVTEHIASSVRAEAERNGSRVDIAVYIARSADPRNPERYAFVWDLTPP